MNEVNENVTVNGAGTQITGCPAGNKPKSSRILESSEIWNNATRAWIRWSTELDTI